ncbi:hypothetical protein TRVL_03236 [Trypanosoma vivax]|nr:hypothetical protein TRVL_03236 [Trypanosoma vivax]
MSCELSSSLSAAEVVAAVSDAPHCMQFPSPVYFARWIDEKHAIVGAGGGGRRFGMANLLAIVSIDTTAQSSSRSNGMEETAQRWPWNFTSAVDMGKNIPWCASPFLKCTDELQLAEGVVGYLAVSHVTCFTLVEVRRDMKTSSFYLRRHACVQVPSDDRNPDKKPIGLIQAAVVVAHDNKGVLIYDLPSLLLRTPLGSTTSNAEGAVEDSGAQGRVCAPGEDPTNEHPTSVCVKPIASWSLPARVNDLHANRFFVPKKVRGRDPSKRRQRYSEYLLIAVLVQDKTLRLARMKLRRGGRMSAGTPGGVASADGDMDLVDGGNVDSDSSVLTLTDACVLTGRDCRIPFTLMKTSMRLVQLFGVEDVASSVLGALWKEVRRKHCEEGTRGEMPIAGLVLVVFDVSSNQSYMLAARVLSTSIPPNGVSSSNCAQHPSMAVTGEMKSANCARGKTSKRLNLRVRFAPEPSPIVKDGITCVSPCDYSRNYRLGSVSADEGIGTALPDNWLAGTVDGALVSILYDSQGKFTAQDVRPSREKRISRLFPALHREPISCVAVSALNDVLSTDIAQKVVVSTLPCCVAPNNSLLTRHAAELATQPYASGEASGVGSCKVGSKQSTKLPETSPLPLLKQETLSLFPTKQKQNWISGLGGATGVYFGLMLATAVLLAGVLVSLCLP